MRDGARIGRRIRQVREQMGIGKSELARRIGVSPTAVHNWEENGVMPRFEMLFAIEKVLEVDIMDLISHRPDEEDEAAADQPLDPVSRRDRLEQLKRQIADLFGVKPNSVEIVIRT
jgi:transcriptional regulator with XRE-family HTH domain